MKVVIDANNRVSFVNDEIVGGIEDDEEPEVSDDEEPKIELKKIVYVDDVFFSLMKIKQNLKDIYDVYPVQSAEKMFELLPRVKPDMILLDINMPDINGFEVMRRIKEDRRNAEVPIIFLTSERSKKSIAEGMSLGAVDFIFKPVSETDLIKCIDYHLQPESREADLPIILAVDDNSSILQSINHLLGDQYTVATLTNPERIKNVMSSITPDLIILDCNMPIYSGFDLVPIIRGMNKHEDTPIIFLTSEGTIDHITVASGLGACDFIVKPINGDVLKNKLKLHLKDYLMHRRLRTV